MERDTLIKLYKAENERLWRELDRLLKAIEDMHQTGEDYDEQNRTVDTGE